MLKRVGSSHTARALLAGSCADDITTWLLLRAIEEKRRYNQRASAELEDAVELVALEPDGALRSIPCPVLYPRLGSYLLDVRVWTPRADRDVCIWFGNGQDLSLTSFDGTSWLSWGVHEGQARPTRILRPVHARELPPAPTDAELPPHRRNATWLPESDSPTEWAQRAGRRQRDSRGWRLFETSVDVRIQYVGPQPEENKPD